MNRKLRGRSARHGVFPLTSARRRHLPRGCAGETDASGVSFVSFHPGLPAHWPSPLGTTERNAAVIQRDFWSQGVFPSFELLNDLTLAARDIALVRCIDTPDLTPRGIKWTRLRRSLSRIDPDREPEIAKVRERMTRREDLCSQAGSRLHDRAIPAVWWPEKKVGDARWAIKLLFAGARCGH